MDCRDPTGKRYLNFHPACWNFWHGIEECPQCPDATTTPMSPPPVAAAAAATTPNTGA